MEANQLMIGNLLLKDNEIIEVDSIYTASDGLHDINGYYIKNYEPIPLTESKLINSGFIITETNKGIDAYYSNIRFTLFQPPNYDNWLLCDDEKVLCELEHYHKLQNIWKLLTNEELTLK